VLGNLGSQVSFRQAINALMGVIFHETYAQPCPLYEPGTEGTVSGFARKKVKDDPANRFIAVNAESVIVALKELQDSLFAAAAPGAAAQQTSKETILVKLGNAKKTCVQTSQQIQSKNVTQGRGFFNAASSAISLAITAVKSKWIPGASVVTISDISQQLDQAISELKKAANLEVVVTPKAKAVPARLNQQIFRPDVWFSAPPRCNVFFPENYFQLQYSRNFMQEPTRLLLKTNDEFFGEDELFDNFYFAPKAVSLKSQNNQLSSLLSNDVMDHELFTGILPVFEKMGELNIFAIRSGTVDGKLPKVGLAQRSTNFLYFKYRFAARQMSVMGKFNPYIACGFPGLIIDKYVDVQTLKEHNRLRATLSLPPRDINKMLGTHFLGNFTEVTHVVGSESW
jgi:hypothetical protein